MTKSETVGIVGVGTIGQFFVEKLVRDGWETVVCDIDEARVADALDSGASRGYENPAALTEHVDIIVLSLPGQPYVETVMEGPDGVLEHLKEDDVVIDTGTMPPSNDVIYQESCAKKGADYVDSGLTLGGPGAWTEENGPSINFFVGGTEEGYEKAKPVFDSLAYSYRRYGGVGVGHVVKAAHRMWQNSRAAVNIELYEFLVNQDINPEPLGDQLELGWRGGYDPDTYPDASGFERVLNGEELETDPGYRVERSGARTRLRQSQWAKDTAYALSIAHSNNTYVPLLSTVYEIQLAAENYAEAIFDRELEFQDDDWADREDIAAVYRLMNRPGDEWRRLLRTVQSA